MIELTDNPDINANDYVMARNMAEYAQRTFPGYQWGVTCDGKTTGVATIFSSLLGFKYRYLMKVRNLMGDEDMKKEVRRACGEILDRYNLSTRGARVDSILALKNGTDGFPVFDPGSMKTRAPQHLVKAYDTASRQKIIVETGWHSKRP